MAARNHNETFILLRNTALKNRSFYKDFNKDDERVKLVTGSDDEYHDDDEDVYDLRNYSDKSVNGHRGSFPSWIASLDEFRYEAFNIRDKVEQLKRLQEEHLKQQNNAIFADEVTSERLKSDELEIDRRCQELSVMFNRLHSILLHFQTLKSSVNKPNSSGSRMVCTIIRNIFQYQVQEVNNLTQLFRSCQRVYLDRRNEATKVDPQFVITFDEDLLNGELMAEGHLIEDSVFFEANDTQAKFHRQTQLQLDDQLELDVSINSHLRQREKEMNCILKSFAELNQIFHEVNTLVVDQGSALDRIDYNLEQVEHHVEMGAVSLEKAHRHITRVRKFKIILTFGLLMFLLLLIIIIRS